MDSLVQHLRRTQQAVRFLERPDRLAAGDRRFPDLTCDALLEIGDGDLWAVDVMAVTAPWEQVGIPTMLDDRLLPIAQQHQIVIEIAGLLPGLSFVDATVRAICASASEDLEGHGEPSPGLTVTWRPVANGGAPEVQFRGVGLGGSASLRDQIAGQIADPLRRKAVKQALAGRQAGCFTAVLLDQSGHDRIAQGTQWLPRHPSTFSSAVGHVLAGLAENHLDAVLLLDLDDTWHLLWGAFHL